jgi:hypothetical protein
MKLSEWDRIFMGTQCLPADRHSLLGRRLGVRVVWIGFICFVMANHAACRRTQFSVSSRVAGHAADNGSLDTSLGVGAGDRGHR